MCIRDRDGIDLNYIHTDHLGRPTFVTDTSGNSIWDGGITTPFGVSLNTVGAFTQNLMFLGQYRDEETGHDQNWNRTYDPELGRYLQSDPIGLAGGLNRYAYVGGNPLNRIDPDGQIWWSVVFGAANLGYQLYKNNGRLDCVNWLEVGGSLIGGGILSGARKGIFKFSKIGRDRVQSNSWRAAKRFMNDRGIHVPRSGQSRHHWMIPRNGWGKNVPDRIKNQPWNINPVNKKFDNWMGSGPRTLLGAPGWAKGIAGGALVSGFELLDGDGCGCK